LAPAFAPCERIRKPVRQLADIAKKRPARPVRRVYLAIELWRESGLSQNKFCTGENLSVKTFSYWHRKYKTRLVEGIKMAPITLFCPTFLNPKNTVHQLKPTVHHEIPTVRSLTKTIPLICFSLVALLNIFRNKNQKDTTMKNTVMMVSKSRNPAGIHQAIAQNGFEYRISEGSAKDQYGVSRRR
jgi:hypothetical protein